LTDQSWRPTPSRHHYCGCSERWSALGILMEAEPESSSLLPRSSKATRRARCVISQGSSTRTNAGAAAQAWSTVSAPRREHVRAPYGIDFLPAYFAKRPHCVPRLKNRWPCTSPAVIAPAIVAGRSFGGCRPRSRLGPTAAAPAAVRCARRQRSAATSSRPSMPSIITSATISSGGCAFAASNAAAPLGTVCTLSVEARRRFASCRGRRPLLAYRCCHQQARNCAD
jgi:hypothetical protein